MSLDPRLVHSLARCGKAPAVVVGTDITGTAIARALAEDGVPVIGVDDRIRRFTGHSRAWSAIHVVKQGFRQPAIVYELERIADQLPMRAALFLSMDHHVTIIGAYGQHLRRRFAFDFPEPENVELLMDKQRFASFAEFNGWAVPHTFTCNAESEVADTARQARFPVLLKPKVKNPRFAANSRCKVFHCQTADELTAAYATVRQWEPGVIVQEWIPGGDDEVYFSFHYLAQDGTEVGSFEGRKLRQHPPRCGNTSAAVPVLEPRLHDHSLAILRAAGAAGFCSVEYKRHPETDVFYITEPTVGRVNLQLGTATGNGVNLPAMAYRHLHALPAYPVRRPRRPRTWVHVKKDFATARHYVARGELTWFRYLASLAGPRIYPVWPRGEYAMARAKALSLVARGRSWVHLPRLAWLTAAAAGAAALFK